MTQEQLNKALDYKAEIDRIDKLLGDIGNTYCRLGDNPSDDLISEFVSLIIRNGYKEKLEKFLNNIWRDAHERKQFLKKKIEEL